MKIYSYAEIAKHNTKDSCWIVINNRVHDVTGFLLEHPGGEDILVDNSGSDATVAFISIAHSPDAQELLKKYQIGTVDEIKPEKEMDGIKFKRLEENTSNMKTFLLPAIIGVGVSVILMYFIF